MHPPPPDELSAKKPLKILCAEDNPMIGEAMQRLFETAGHRAEHVPDGLEAWDRLSRDLGYFDVVITDHEMPGLNGLELVELLRQVGYPGRIVVHSGAVSLRLAQSYRALRVDAIFAKLTPGGDLVGRVERLVV